MSTEIGIDFLSSIQRWNLSKIEEVDRLIHVHKRLSMIEGVSFHAELPLSNEKDQTGRYINAQYPRKEWMARSVSSASPESGMNSHKLKLRGRGKAVVLSKMNPTIVTGD